MAKQAALTNHLAEYCATTLSRGLPDDAVEKSKNHLLDTLAAVISGARMEPGRLGHRFVRQQGGRKEASVFASKFRTTATNAALANAMAAHADETDDSHPASITHPGCAVIPAALAMVETSDRSGEDLLKAIALGYDMTARFGMALGGGKLIDDGWDSHAIAGTFGAGAAAGCLQSTDPVDLTNILSYTAQQSSGLATLFRDRDHVEKAFVFAGMPARDGVAAAAMVATGWTGVADPFDGTPSFFSAFSAAKPDKWFRDLGRVYAVTQTNIKRWSVGSPIQAALDSLEAILAANTFDLRLVEKVEIHLPTDGAAIVDGRNMPDVNVQYLSAVMLLDGTVSFAASHDHDRMVHADIQSLQPKVELVSSSLLAKAKPARQAIAEITLSDGRVLKHRTRAVRGTTDNPMSREEVESKAQDLIAPVLGTERTRKIIRTIRTLEKVKGLDRLIQPLRGG